MPGLDIVTTTTALEVNPKFIISNILRSIPTDHKVTCIIDKRVQPNGLVSYLAKMCTVKGCGTDNLYQWVSLEGLGDEWSMVIENFEHETSVKAISSTGSHPSSCYSMTRDELEQNGLIDPEQEQELQRLQQAGQKAKRKKLFEKQKQDRLNDTKGSGDLRKLRSRNSSNDEVDELVKRKRGRPKKRHSPSSDQDFDNTDSFPSGHELNKNNTEEQIQQQQQQEHRPQKPEKSLEPAKKEIAVVPEIRLPSIKLLDDVQPSGGLVTVAPAAPAPTVSTSSGIYPRHSPFHFYNVQYYQKPIHHQILSCSGCGCNTSPDQFKYNGWAQTSNGLYYCKPCQYTRPPTLQQQPKPSRPGGAAVQRHL